MKMRQLLIAACLPLAAGCAGPEARERECKADWLETGSNEGWLGAMGMAEIHAAHCSSFDAARYQEGYDKGFAQRAKPMM